MNTSSNDRSVQSILDRIKEEYKVNPVREKKGAGGTTEFTFAKEQHGGSLVFREVKTDALTEVQNEPKRAEPIEPPTPEFDLPDAFTVADRYDTPSTPEPPPRMYHTYVPRFTEASEKYRMAMQKGLEKDEPNAQEAVEEAATEPQTPVDPMPTIDAQNQEELDTDTALLPKTEEEKEDPNAAIEDERAQIFALIHGENAPAEEPTDKPQTSDLEDAALPQEEPTVSDREKGTESDPIEGVTEAERSIPDPVVEPSADFAAPDYAVGGASEQLPGDEILDMTKGRRRSSEYTSYAQRLAFKDRFLDVLMSLKVRFFTGLLLALVLLIYENVAWLGFDGARALSFLEYPSIRALVDLQLVVCMFALAIPEIVGAIRALFAHKVRCEIFFVASFLVYATYLILMSVLAPASYPLLGFLFALSALTLIGGAHFRESAMFLSFKLISIGGVKRIVEKRLTRTLAKENIALDGVVDEYRSRTARVFKTAFVSDFFKRSAKNSENVKENVLLLALIAGVSAVVGAVAFFIPGGAVAAASGFATTFLLSVPVFAFLSRSLPFYHAQLVGLDADSTVIGETSLHDYAAVDVVTFDDVDIFGKEDVALKRFTLYGDNGNLTKAMRQMSALFAVVGGPLNSIFSGSLDRRVAPAQHTVIEDDGVRGIIDGATVHAGSAAYMAQHGILIPAEDRVQKNESAATMRIMYAAENQKIYAKFYIRYSFSEEFTMALPQLRASGMTPLIYTRDPNIGSELIMALTTGEDCIRVMKKHTPVADDDRVYSRVSAGLVTLGDKDNAIEVLLLAKRYVKLQKTFAGMALACTIVGLVGSAVLSIFCPIAVPSVLLGVFHAAWVAALALISRIKLLKK